MRPPLAMQLRERLAEDERLGVLDIDVKIVEGRVYLHGQVASEELRVAAQAIAEEASEGLPVENRLVVSIPARAPGTEQIR